MCGCRPHDSDRRVKRVQIPPKEMMTNHLPAKGAMNPQGPVTLASDSALLQVLEK